MTQIKHDLWDQNFRRIPAYLTAQFFFRASRRIQKKILSTLGPYFYPHFLRIFWKHNTANFCSILCCPNFYSPPGAFLFLEELAATGLLGDEIEGHHMSVIHILLGRTVCTLQFGLSARNMEPCFFSGLQKSTGTPLCVSDAEG